MLANRAFGVEDSYLVGHSKRLPRGDSDRGRIGDSSGDVSRPRPGPAGTCMRRRPNVDDELRPQLCRPRVRWRRKDATKGNGSRPSDRQPSSVGGVLTLGIDLAAEPKKAGIAWVYWAEGEARVTDSQLGATDQILAEPVPVLPLEAQSRTVERITALNEMCNQLEQLVLAALSLRRDSGVSVAVHVAPGSQGASAA